MAQMLAGSGCRINKCAAMLSRTIDASTGRGYETTPRDLVASEALGANSSCCSPRLRNGLFTNAFY
jgi:hypothetical protein